MPTQTKILREVLAVLISHWGAEAVAREVNRLQRQLPGATSAITTVRHENELRKEPKRRPKPTEILARYQIPDRIRDDAVELTKMYEKKTFLPTIVDVKNFLESRGRPITGIKNRDQAFLRVIDLVLGLPDDYLKHLRNSAAHGLPARLGPISDAIGSAGETIRARRLGRITPR
jgi:hypothetical protein